MATASYLEARSKAASAPRGQTEIAPPYRTFQNTAGAASRSGDAFYLRAAGDFPLLQFGDQYVAAYLPKSLSARGSITVKLDNPDVRTNWVGRAGIMVRNDITQPDHSKGYVILASSPAAGSSLEWDSQGNGRLNQHTEFDGYTVWPHWLKLERQGAHFTGFVSENGTDWTKIGEAEASGALDTLDAGMFVYRDSARFQGFQIDNDDSTAKTDR